MSKVKVLLLAILLVPLNAISASMECKIGPIEKNFGENKWLVYACSDNKSIVVVSAPGNPAMPFYFSVSPVDGKYTVSGEGNGDKVATASAYEELIMLREEDVIKIIAQAKKV